MNNLSDKINLNSRQIIDIILLILLLIFVGQNLELVKVRFLFFGFEMPLIIIIILAFFVGYYTSQAFSKTKKQDKNEFAE